MRPLKSCRLKIVLNWEYILWLSKIPFGVSTPGSVVNKKQGGVSRPDVIGMGLVFWNGAATAATPSGVLILLLTFFIKVKVKKYLNKQSFRMKQPCPWKGELFGTFYNAINYSLNFVLLQINI